MKNRVWTSFAFLLSIAFHSSVWAGHQKPPTAHCQKTLYEVKDSGQFIGRASFGAQHQYLNKLLNSIDSRILHPIQERITLQKNADHPLTVRDLLVTWERRLASIQKDVASLRGNSPREDQFLNRMIYRFQFSQSIQGKIEFQASLLDEVFDDTNPVHLQFLSEATSGAKGLLGELNALLRMNRVVAYGITLGGDLPKKSDPLEKEVHDFFIESITNAFDQLPKKPTDKFIHHLARMYPLLIDEHMMNIAPSKALGLLHKKINSKEIDIVTRKQDGTLVCVEIKNFDYPVRAEHLELGNSDRGNKKWRHFMKQQSSFMQTLRFLGLNNKVVSAIYLRHGITHSAAKTLENLGILVLGPRFSDHSNETDDQI